MTGNKLNTLEFQPSDRAISSYIISRTHIQTSNNFLTTVVSRCANSSGVAAPSGHIRRVALNSTANICCHSPAAASPASTHPPWGGGGGGGRRWGNSSGLEF